MHTGDFTQRRLQKKNTKRRPYAQKLLHTESFTNQKYFARRCFAQRRFCIEKFLQREACTWNTEQLLHTRVFSRRSFYTQTLLTQRPLTQKLWHREALTQSSFYKRNLLQTEAFTHWTDKKLYARKRLHRTACTPRPLTHRNFYSQTLLDNRFATLRLPDPVASLLFHEHRYTRLLKTEFLARFTTGYNGYEFRNVYEPMHPVLWSGFASKALYRWPGFTTWV
jgi:hypothetical protein